MIICWETKNVLNGLDDDDFTRLVFTFTVFFSTCLRQREISHDQESLIIASGLSINKPLMIDYICYFTIPRKSWTDSSEHENLIHYRCQLTHVYKHLLLVINFARKAGIYNGVWCIGKFAVVIMQSTNELHVTVPLFWSISHITTKYAHEAQPREHSSRTFVHVWNDLVRFLAEKQFSLTRVTNNCTSGQSWFF